MCTQKRREHALDLMTTAELATLLRANVFTVRRWVHAGRLPQPYSAGPHGRWLFERREVARWIAERWTAFDSVRRRHRGGGAKR